MAKAKIRIKAVVEAAKIVGGAAKLAELLGCSYQTFYQWPRVPAERVLQIEKATGGKITRHDLRPDLYPIEAAA